MWFQMTVLLVDFSLQHTFPVFNRVKRKFTGCSPKFNNFKKRLICSKQSVHIKLYFPRLTSASDLHFVWAIGRHVTSANTAASDMGT